MIKEHEKKPFFRTAFFVGTAEDRSALYVGRSQLSRSQYGHRQPQAEHRRDQVAHDADERKSEELRAFGPIAGTTRFKFMRGRSGSGEAAFYAVILCERGRISTSFCPPLAIQGHKLEL